MVKQIVEPIKDTNVLKQVEGTLKDSFKFGVRNYTIFQVGKATLLRVSDVLSLRLADVFDDHGNVHSRAYIHDQKTGKANTLYLEPVKQDLEVYYRWLQDNEIQSQWLFPSLKKQHKDTDEHINERQFYRVMQKVGDLLNLNYLGTHSMRKTGAYRVYIQTNYDIGLVQDLLNHSSQKMTLKYLGLDQVSKEKKLSQIDFG